MQSSNESDKKVIHWFEWGKRKLHLYDISTNTTECIELDIHFKIPSFSRSILLPDSKIYLLGYKLSNIVGKNQNFMLEEICMCMILKKITGNLKWKNLCLIRSMILHFAFLINIFMLYQERKTKMKLLNHVKGIAYKKINGVKLLQSIIRDMQQAQ